MSEKHRKPAAFRPEVGPALAESQTPQAGPATRRPRAFAEGSAITPALIDPFE